MFWLKILGVGVLLTVGIFVIAFLEDVLVSAPRRRQLKQKALDKLNGNRMRD